MERYLREGMTYSSKGFLIFLQRPISATLLAIMVFALIWPFIRDARERRKVRLGKETEIDRLIKQSEEFNVRDN